MSILRLVSDGPSTNPMKENQLKTGGSELYQPLLSSLCKKQWQRMGLKRRGGVAVPLFSLYSARSIGIGELPDLKLLIDWCRLTGMSIIQLLPMNDVGFDFRPYDAHSSFALDPMYLSLGELVHVNLKPFRGETDLLRKKFPPGPPKVHYWVKAAKLNLLWQIFRRTRTEKIRKFHRFIEENQYWLRDYAVFKVMKEKWHETSWEAWEKDFKARCAEAVRTFECEHNHRILFYEWLQWQLYEQFRAVKRYARKRGILLMGDLPFLVSRDSVDVWSHQDYFKLDFSAGAPPDRYMAKGQRWGMPPYDWENIAKHDYDYLIQKLRYAQNFYDLFRIDHVVGIFRLWTIPLSEPLENGGLNGFFDPWDEREWEGHGRKLLSVMVENTEMLPCAEDLGVVPTCSYKVLEEFGIPGMDVQRWEKDWGKTYDFKSPEEYRVNAVATLSSHDMSSLVGWWIFEAGTVDRELFGRKCEARGIFLGAIEDKLFDLEKSCHGRLRWKKEIESVDQLVSVLGHPEKELGDIVDLFLGSYDEKKKFCRFLGFSEDFQETTSVSFVRQALEKINRVASVFSIQLLQEWLSLEPSFQYDPWEFRINFPGTMSEKNWGLVMPFSLEKMKKLTIHREIKAINIRTHRS